MRRREEGASQVIVLLVVIGVFLFLFLAVSQMAAATATHSRVMEVTHAAMLRMEKTGGLTPGITAMIRSELSQIASTDGIAITGTVAPQPYGAELTLRIDVSQDTEDIGYVFPMPRSNGTKSHVISAAQKGYSTYDSGATLPDPPPAGEEPPPPPPPAETLGITITSPADGASVSGYVPITTDYIGAVTRVEFMVDGKVFAISTTSPFTATWDTSTATDAGTYVLVARAYDGQGENALSQLVAVNVRSSAGDLIVPYGQTTPLAAGSYTYRNVDVQGTLAISGKVSIQAETFSCAGTVDGIGTGYTSAGPGSSTTSAYAAGGYGGNGGGATSVSSGTFFAGGVAYDAQDGLTIDAGSGRTCGGGAGLYVAATHISVPGVINVTGKAGSVSNYSGGSGGGILLYGKTINVQGYLYADGARTTSSYGGAGGGGGRIKLFGEAIAIPSGHYSVTGGTGCAGSSYTGQNGSPGTFYQETRTYSIAGPADTMAPAVALTSPLGSAQLNGMVFMAASATDTSGVGKVQFQLDGQKIGEVTTAPFQFLWDSSYTSDGLHVLRAMAVDSVGNVGYSPSLSVTVDHNPTDTSAPEVAITNPTDGLYTNAASLSIVATAVDQETGVNRVECLIDGVLKATLYQSPWNALWTLTGASQGLHTVTIKAYDFAGNSGTAQVQVYYDTAKPTVSLTAPTTGTKTGVITVTASASDTLKLASLVVKVDGVIIGGSSASPLSFSWDTGTVANGAHSVQATATDAAGNATNSTAVSITVSNP